MLSTVSAMKPQSMPECRVVQIIGGLGEVEAEVHGAELVRRMAEVLSCRPRNLHAPGIVASRSVRDALVRDPQVADTLALARSADIALLAIGSLGPNAVLRSPGSVLTESDCEELRSLGIVGDIALRFFDADGNSVDNPYTERIVGIDLDEMQAIQRRVGVAGGIEKISTIFGALQAKRINVLVTDDITAEALIEAADSSATTGDTKAIDGGER
jgi:DNA-binding transcriptional regulator LsrR (DeoR family)